MLGALSVWLLGVFATSAQLHEVLHADAGETGHTCAITLFSEGLEDSQAWAEVVVAPAFFPASDIIAVVVPPLADAANRLPPGRGPPLC